MSSKEPVFIKPFFMGVQVLCNICLFCGAFNNEIHTKEANKWKNALFNSCFPASSSVFSAAKSSHIPL